jgi:hypothetical protein
VLEVWRAALAGDDQVVDSAEEGKRQRLGVGAWADPAELLLLGVEVVGSGFVATRLISAWAFVPNTATMVSVRLPEAATAALSGTRQQCHTAARRGRMQLQLVGDDGSVIAHGEAAVELLPR